MKKTTFFLAAILIFFSTSCEEEPAPATNPDGILHCKINGQYWEAYDFQENDGTPFGWGTGATDLQYYDYLNSADLSAARVTKNRSVDQALGFSARQVRIGKNSLLSNTGGFTDWALSRNCIEYEMDGSSLGFLNIISIDTIHYRMVGEFEFSAVNTCNDTIHITEGYFDLQYRF